MYKFIEENSFLRSISIFVATLLFCGVLVFIILPILSIILGYRWLVELVAKWFLKEKLGKLVSARSVIFGGYSKNKFAKFCTLVEQQLISATIPNTDQLLYPEFTSTISAWMGYLFWVPCTNFDIKNHVMLLQDIDKPPFNPDDLMYVNNLIVYLSRGRIWEKNKPFWEFILAENVIPQLDPCNNKSFIIFRAHHSLGDGWSLFKVLNKLFGTPTILSNSAKAQFKNQVNARFAVITYLTGLWVWTKLPFKMTELLLTLALTRTQSGIMEVPEHSDDLPDAFGITQEILPLDHLKRLKNKLGVDFHSLIIAGIGAAIRKMYLSRGDKVPDNVNLTYPLPMPGHPDKLRNHMSGGVILLPIGEPDPGKRVRMISSRVQSWMKAGLPLSLFHISRLIGSIPLTVLRRFERTPPILFTNIVGPSEPLYWDGKLISDARFFVNVPYGIDYVIGIFTYCNRTNLVVGGHYFADLNHVQEFIEECVKGWEELEMLADDKTSIMDEDHRLMNVAHIHADSLSETKAKI